jgi:hypothetical protein
MCVIFTVNYFLVDVSIDNEMFLVTDFVNFKIKSTQFFGCAHRDRVYMRVFIEVSVHI